MEFASPFVYDYDEPEYEYVSDEEYDVGMNISDSGSDSDEWHDEASLESKGTNTTDIARDAVHREVCESDVVGEAVKSVPVTTAGAVGSLQPPPPPPSSGAPPPPSPVGAPPPPPARALLLPQKKNKKKHHWKKRLSEISSKCLKREAPEESHPPIPPLPSRGRKFRRADTNVVSVKLNKLTSPSNMHAGDPVVCNGCSAILSHVTKLITDGPDKVWQCDFCNERNLVDVEDEEIPQNDDVTFLIEPAPATAASGPSGVDESLVIFCVDISGSMCVTTEVPGRLKLRGSGGLQRMQSLNDTHEDQHMPRQRRDVTYVSRLQAVQAAVDHQLEEMSKDHPSRRVALITFDNEVTIIGDGTISPIAIAGDKLTDKDTLSRLGSEIATPKAIKETRKLLGDKLFSLEEGGATALGPSLVVAVAMASHNPGSKVIICTDGMANVGMGKLDEFSSKQNQDEAESFYEDIGNNAVEEGVAVSVITIQGTDCKLFQLGKLADKTGGQVNIVDPLKLTQEFSTILADCIVATGVIATFILHKELYFMNEEIDVKESKVVQEVGNVTTNTEITFEYGVRHNKTKKTPHSPPKTGEDQELEQAETESDGASTSQKTEESSKPKELPFQLQIRYTDAEGMKALRVVTQTKPVTKDRHLAEKNVNLNVMGIHCAKQSSHLALAGEYTLARGTAFMNQRLAWRSAAQAPETKSWYKRVYSKVKSVENHVCQAQVSERSRRGTTYSDDEEMDELHDDGASLGLHKIKKMEKKKKLKARGSEVSDEMASTIYQFRNMSSKGLSD